MSKKFACTVLFAICVFGLSFGSGCSGGPADIQMGQGSTDSFTEGIGETEDGEQAPNGAAAVD